MGKLRTQCELFKATLLRKLLFKPWVIFPFPDTFHYWHRKVSGLVMQLAREKVHTDDAAWDRGLETESSTGELMVEVGWFGRGPGHLWDAAIASVFFYFWKLYHRHGTVCLECFRSIPPAINEFASLGTETFLSPNLHLIITLPLFTEQMLAEPLPNLRPCARNSG